MALALTGEGIFPVAKLRGHDVPPVGAHRGTEAVRADERRIRTAEPRAGGSAVTDQAACIKDMQDSFSLLDGLIEDINEMTEEGNSLDGIRVKAVFFALYFGAEAREQRSASSTITGERIAAIIQPIPFLARSSERSATAALMTAGLGKALTSHHLRTGLIHTCFPTTHFTPASKTMLWRCASCCWTTAWTSMPISSGQRTASAVDMSFR